MKGLKKGQYIGIETRDGEKLYYVGLDPVYTAYGEKCITLTTDNGDLNNVKAYCRYTRPAIIYKRALKHYFALETATDLRREKITLSDHEIIYDILKLFNTYGYNEDHAGTISENVANYFTRQGFNVTPSGCGWSITLV